jgi:hypothetical protein
LYIPNLLCHWIEIIFFFVVVTPPATPLCIPLTISKFYRFKQYQFLNLWLSGSYDYNYFLDLHKIDDYLVCDGANSDSVDADDEGDDDESDVGEVEGKQT